MSETTVEKSSIDVVIDDLFNEFVPLIRKWKAHDAGSLDNWIGLLKQIMRGVEKVGTISGESQNQQ